MKCNVHVVCSDLLAGVFELAGVDVAVADTSKDAQTILSDLLAAARWGVVIVDRVIMTGLPDRLQERLKDCSIPLFVDLPLSAEDGKAGEQASSSEYVSEMVRQAVGKKIAVNV